MVSQCMPESLCLATDRAARCPKEVVTTASDRSGHGVDPVRKLPSWCVRLDSNQRPRRAGTRPLLPTELLTHVAHRLAAGWAYEVDARGRVGRVGSRPWCRQQASHLYVPNGRSWNSSHLSRVSRFSAMPTCAGFLRRRGQFLALAMLIAMRICQALWMGQSAKSSPSTPTATMVPRSQ